MKSLPRLAKTTSQRIVRNPQQAFAAIFVMFLTFFSLAGFVLIFAGSNTLLSYFESRPQVTAFFKDDTKVEQIDDLKSSLNETGKISKLKYISKEEALAIYKERNKNEPILLEFVTADILPSSLEVSATDVKDLSSIAEILKNEQSVEEVVFQKDIVDTLIAWTSTIRTAGAGLVIFLLVTSFFITLIVIGLNISIHKEEIEIMRLVGATKWYIRTPFIFEGVFYGVTSAILATTAVWGALLWFSPVLQKIFAGIPLFPVPTKIFFLLLAGEMLIGILIGITGAYIATRRYLKV